MAGARAHDRLVKGTAGHTCPASAPPSRDKPLQQLAVYDWPAGCTQMFEQPGRYDFFQAVLDLDRHLDGPGEVLL